MKLHKIRCRFNKYLTAEIALSTQRLFDYFSRRSAISAVSFAVPLDQQFIDPWFNKHSYADHFRDNIRANVIASGISLELVNYLNQKGYPSLPLTANTAYRDDSKKGRYDEIPPTRKTLKIFMRPC